MPLVCFVFLRINEKGFQVGGRVEGAKIGRIMGPKWTTNVHLICILQSGIMLKGQEKQQQVIKNSKKCFVFFFIYVYDVLFLLQWFTVWFLLRSRYLFDVFVIILFLIYIYQIKKKELLLFYICVFTGTLFTYLDNNIGINRKITRNCLFCYVYCLFVVVCLLSFVCHLKSKELCSVGQGGGQPKINVA